MTNKIERQRYPDAKSISYDRLMALTLIVSTILALIFVLAPVGLLYFFVGEWTKWQNFGVIIGWSVGFLAYLWLATHASSFEALGAAARSVNSLTVQRIMQWLTCRSKATVAYWWCFWGCLEDSAMATSARK